MSFVARLQIEAVSSAVRDNFLGDVLNGLGRPQKAIPPKYLYDAQGSALFDRICELPEYYLTRNETAILAREVASIIAAIGHRPVLVEFGSGSSTKTRLLLDRGKFLTYMPIDVSAEHLGLACEQLERRYPALRIEPVLGDYSTLSVLPEPPPPGHAVGFFPGSTIGNLTPDEAVAFLANSRRLLGGDGAILIGVDRDKKSDVLNAAYNDSAGVTAAFSMNLLARINRELGANFDLAQFRHLAFHNPAEHRVELYVESLRDQIVRLGNAAFAFRKGERIHTEYSYKYPRARFLDLAARAGYRALQTWTDEDATFDIHLLAAAQ
jgi:dimethylhistidine N-methyltransferase